MIQSLRRGNMLLAFLLEVAMLAAFCYAGWVSTNILWLRVTLAVGLPALAIVLWAVWAAPRAGKRRLQMPGLMVFKLAIFAAATVAWWMSGQAFFAAIFGALVVINLLGMLAFRQF